MRYYSARNRPKALTLHEFHRKLSLLYLFFFERNYFKTKAGIATDTGIPDTTRYKAGLAFGFDPFPIEKWEIARITEDNIFDMLEFLHEHASKPGEWGYMKDGTGWSYQDYLNYDDATGQAEFREKANEFLCDYGAGFQISDEGMVLSMGPGALQAILVAEIEPYDEENVDSKVRGAILKWRNRHLDGRQRREAIRELADVFEWLQKTRELGKVLAAKDESDLFNIANNFAIRHHNPEQRQNYDPEIWYPWMFHFYLATYHAVIKALKRGEKTMGPQQEG